MDECDCIVLKWEEIVYVRAGMIPFNCYSLQQCRNCKLVRVSEKSIDQRVPKNGDKRK